jgi:hypothetical protein
LRGAQRDLDAGGFELEATLAAGAFEQRAQLRLGERRARGGGGRGGQDGAGLGAQQPVPLVGERGQHAGVVLAQQRAELVVRAGALPDRVLLGAGQHGDRLGEFGVGRQPAVRGHVGAQDVGEDERVAGVGLLPGDRVPVAVAGDGHRVDREHLSAGGA